MRWQIWQPHSCQPPPVRWEQYLSCGGMPRQHSPFCEERQFLYQKDSGQKIKESLTEGARASSSVFAKSTTFCKWWQESARGEGSAFPSSASHSKHLALQYFPLNYPLSFKLRIKSIRSEQLFPAFVWHLGAIFPSSFKHRSGPGGGRACSLLISMPHSIEQVSEPKNSTALILY